MIVRDCICKYGGKDYIASKQPEGFCMKCHKLKGNAPIGRAGEKQEEEKIKVPYVDKEGCCPSPAKQPKPALQSPPEAVFPDVRVLHFYDDESLTTSLR
jgi:hypothetical protein